MDASSHPNELAMILTCPSCQKRFVVDPAKLQPNGRKVRCGSCRHTWHQEPPETLPVVVAEPVAPPPPRRARAAATPSADARSPLAARIAWAALAAVVVVTLAAFLLLREAIVEQWPAAERVYALVGMVEDPAVGLDLRRVSSRESTRNGVRVLLIEGEVANVSGKVRDIPRLRGGLYDERDRALKTWSFSAPDPKLLPGETTRFVTELENPPQGAVRLTIVFDGDK